MYITVLYAAAAKCPSLYVCHWFVFILNVTMDDFPVICVHVLYTCVITIISVAFTFSTYYY